ncbi:MAG TPA: hypothetical protein PK854_08235 [Oscillospiraceae bacterium]|nr:hypothetical protein [Oscillospiraceae bacterium]HPS35239.1 hypothetical protein [Oscillospiraceae bacterium]
MQLSHQIGKGAHADIYLEDGFTYKAFRSVKRKTDAFWEASVTTVAEDAGLPVARIYEVLSNDEIPILEMDYIQGETLLDLMIKEPENCKPISIG